MNNSCFKSGDVPPSPTDTIETVNDWSSRDKLIRPTIHSNEIPDSWEDYSQTSGDP